MKYIYLILYFSFISNIIGFTQQNSLCGTDEIKNAVLSENSDLSRINEKLFLNFKEYYSSRESEFDSILIIPVVFHILHNAGIENISDDQVYDAMEILNKDFGKMNADTLDVIPEFQNLIANVKIQFRLATKDPDGNCTNGVEHILSYETWIGDNHSKINPWPSNKYLNIWVVGTIEMGYAGYATFPQYINPTNQFKDGIVIDHNYLGSIGTSNTQNSRVLSHEVGHYLGLPHIWGSGPVETECGDDGFNDTPITKGWYGCPITSSDNCVPGIEENFQNFMDYSYCNRMFTHEQAAFMRYILSSGYADRHNLSLISNLAETGTELTSAPLCAPKADFMVGSLPLFCDGDSVLFKNLSWGSTIDNYQWSFPTGNPSTSTLQNPKVKFNSPGFHDVTLTVSNAAGSHTKTIEQAVWVSYPWADNFGPYNENFEGETADDWRKYNRFANDVQWELTNDADLNSNQCYKLNFYPLNNPDPQLPLRMEGNYNYLFSPMFDLTNTSAVEISFDYSGATGNSSPSDYMEIFIGHGCGRFLYKIGEITGSDLLPAGWCGTNFIPNDSQWSHYSITINPSLISSLQNVRFVFGYRADDFTNNFYLDHFNVNGILSTAENSSTNLTSTIFPNPLQAGEDLHIQTNMDGEIVLSLFDINGKLVFSDNYFDRNSGEIVIPQSKLEVKPGVYTLHISNSDTFTNSKLIIL